MNKEQINEILNGANNVHDLADVIYNGIETILNGLVDKGVFVDNGISVIPYENFDMNDEEQANAVQEWEQKFVYDAARLAYFRWCQGD
jgi:hypothetical protein